MQLNSTGEVIDALGGTAALAKLLSVGPDEIVKMQVVTNWRSMEQFPAHTYVAIKAALKAAGHEAPDSLWRMLGVRENGRVAAQGR